MTWRGRHMATRHSAKAAGRWTATASGSPATGPATWQDANTTSGRPPRSPHRLNMRSLVTSKAYVPLAPQRPLCGGLEEVQEDCSRRSAEGTVPGPEPRSQQSVQPGPGLSACSKTTLHRCTSETQKLLFCFQDLPNNMIHQVPIKSLPQEWLWCETWCDDRSKKSAKTIDLVRTGPPGSQRRRCSVRCFHPAPLPSATTR